MPDPKTSLDKAAEEVQNLIQKPAELIVVTTPPEQKKGS